MSRTDAKGWTTDGHAVLWIGTEYYYTQHIATDLYYNGAYHSTILHNSPKLLTGITLMTIDPFSPGEITPYDILKCDRSSGSSTYEAADAFSVY